ncbi:peptidase [Litorimonas cladophorae]|uniref:Peptidase n=1 Tax=Litorimonas cladophorae TaxID=1220491 RepID=A0A918KFS5_9PROT|nr:amidohydrolase [Litorimonas cladophorae]GGX61936.1 peptidase [Litorimonas cladophorae]
MAFKSITLGFLLTAATLPVTAFADDTLRKDIAADYNANLESLFTHFHQNPELSFLESKTATRLASEIKAFGYDVTEGVGGTGIVAVMKNGAGPTVMIRADMDGLPVKEDSGLSYASTALQIDRDGVEKPVMHACGHDVHITSLVGAARQMAARKDRWSGTLVLIGQPAEELISGARAMLEDGLYTRFPKPDYALGFHVSAGIPSGRVEVAQGIAMSSSDSVDIIVKGVGAHGASPHKGIDPVLVASQIVVSLQSVVSRSIAPLEPGVITVGSIHGGNKHNIISDEVKMQLTVRSDSPKIRKQLLDGIDRVVEGVAISLDVPEELMPEVIRSKTQTTPPTINDRATAERVISVFEEKLPNGTLFSQPRQGMGAEDFSYFITPETGVKGVYFWVGGTPEKDVEDAPSHHSPFFKVEPEPSITLGTEATVLAALDLLQKK